jgi:transcriptional regulator with XRE-family HTH domain
MSAENVNAHLAEKLNGLIKSKKITAEQLVELLHCSKDSLYRRLRGETDFLLKDAVIIAEFLNMSIDALYAENTGQILFKTREFTNVKDPIHTVEAYLNALVADMERLHKAGVLDLYYAAKDLPLFCFFAHKDLIPFKLYFWYITLFDEKAERKPYSHNWLPKSISNKATELYNLYLNTDSIEIWNFETINSTIHQVHYCIEAGTLSYKDAITILNAMTDYATTLDTYASAGRKNGKGKLTMYLNEILLLDNSVIFDLGMHKFFYLPYQTLNFVSTSDESFVQNNLNWFHKQRAKSTSIVGEDATKSRNRLIGHYIKEINKAKDKIKLEHD